MNAKEVVKALRCSASTAPNRSCSECPYLYRDEPVPGIVEQYGDVPDDLWDNCDCDRIALDAADMIEQLLKEVESIGTADV